MWYKADTAFIDSVFTHFDQTYTIICDFKQFDVTVSYGNFTNSHRSFFYSWLSCKYENVYRTKYYLLSRYLKASNRAF